MNYSDYSISLVEFEEYSSKGSTLKLTQIWEDILSRLESIDPELKSEATKNGFELADNPDLEEDIIAFYKVISIPNASEELSESLNNKLYPFVVVLKSEEDDDEDEFNY